MTLQEAIDARNEAYENMMTMVRRTRDILESSGKAFVADRLTESVYAFARATRKVTDVGGLTPKKEKSALYCRKCGNEHPEHIGCSAYRQTSNADEAR